MLEKLKIQKKFSILETTGLPLIDLDHNRLIILLRYIVESIKKGKRLSKIQRLAKYLDGGLKIHFLHEEEVMKAIQYPSIEHHRNEHLEMLDHYRNFIYTINSKSCRQNLLENFLEILDLPIIVRLYFFDNSPIKYEDTALPAPPEPIKRIFLFFIPPNLVL